MPSAVTNLLIIIVTVIIALSAFELYSTFFQFKVLHSYKRRM
jgi:hypothetical protein